LRHGLPQRDAQVNWYYRPASGESLILAETGEIATPGRENFRQPPQERRKTRRRDRKLTAKAAKNAKMGPHIRAPILPGGPAL